MGIKHTNSDRIERGTFVTYKRRAKRSSEWEDSFGQGAETPEKIPDGGNRVSPRQGCDSFTIQTEVGVSAPN
jgi:hypothetical protein